MNKNTIKVRADHTLGNISPLIYGDFIEYIDSMIDGMWAEKIKDRAFEGVLPPSGGRYYREVDDFKKNPWRTYGYRASVDCGLDKDNPFVGTQSMRLTITDAKGGHCALVQDGIAVKAGKCYQFEVYMRQQGMSGKVTVALGEDRGAFIFPYAETSFENLSNGWAKYTANLKPTVSNSNASLIIMFSNVGSLWIDKVSLMPEDSISGWRADVVQKVRELNPRILRFGGSSLLFYFWEDGIGPREKRVPFKNEPWGEMESHDVGLEEFLEFCRLTDCEPLICVNASTDTPQDAANQVEYINGSVSTKYGAVRAANGHPEPYGVKYWQIGNELRGEEYDQVCVEFCRSMKAVDPNIILMSSYPSETVLKTAGEYLDYICPHYYSDPIERIQSDIDGLRSMISRLSPNKEIKLGITEWNSTGSDWGLDRAHLATLDNALFCARALHVYQRNCDIVHIANRSNLVNSFCGGAIQTKADDLYVNPVFHIQKLLSNYSGNIAVKCECEVTGLDVMATRCDSGAVTVTVINYSEEDIEATVDLSEFTCVSQRAELWMVRGNDRTAVNGFAHPNTITPVPSTISTLDKKILHRFPKLSFSLLRWLP